MRSAEPRPALFIDFDNTITLGDVLDQVIERYSESDAWRTWEDEWQAGRLSTAECLHRQIAGLRASPQELLQFVSTTEIDPAFPRIVAWARSADVDLCILSDNFDVIIREILDRHGLPPVLVRANDLEFRDGRIAARFPYRDPGCSRCAHCKAQHLRATAGRPRIFVGDGLSDLCPAHVADVVFAKDSLASALQREGVAFHPYRELGEVLLHLQGRHERLPD